MPVVGVPLDEFFAALGRSLEVDQLVDALHRFGCSVEGRVQVVRYRCAQCGAISEAPEGESPPPTCDGCGRELRARQPERIGVVETLRMELLAVRPDVFDPAGLARAMKGFLGDVAGAPHYLATPSEWSVVVDRALEGPGVRRPRIACAIVENVTFTDARLRALMKLQENVHWALGRDRKLASIGVYDLAKVQGPRLRYRAVARDGVRFVPLGFDSDDPTQALTPEQILARHPKGQGFAWILDGAVQVPLLEDAAGQVLAFVPIINSERTRVTMQSKSLLIDVTGLDDRQVDRALALIVTSLCESCPQATVRSVRIEYEASQRITPDLRPQTVELSWREAADLIGVELTSERACQLLRAMRHDVVGGEESLRVEVAPFRADIMHPRDLIEDLAIAYGYDEIPERIDTAFTFGKPHVNEQLAAVARAACLGAGLVEVMTLPLSNEELSFERCGLPRLDQHVVLAHPISVDQTMLRVSILPGLLETLAINLGHEYPQRIFEVGLATQLDPRHEAGAGEFLLLAAALAGDGIGYADVRALADALLGELRPEHRRLVWEPSTAGLFATGRGAELSLDGAWIGRLGEVHPAVLERFRIIHPVALLEFKLPSVD